MLFMSGNERTGKTLPTEEFKALFAASNSASRPRDLSRLARNPIVIKDLARGYWASKKLLRSTASETRRYEIQQGTDFRAALAIFGEYHEQAAPAIREMMKEDHGFRKEDHLEEIDPYTLARTYFELFGILQQHYHSGLMGSVIRTDRTRALKEQKVKTFLELLKQGKPREVERTVTEILS